MNPKIKFILVAAFLFNFNSLVFPLVNPLYDLRVTNIQSGSLSPTESNTLYFDLIIYHTNLPNSGPFEFAAGKYVLSFNPAINGGGHLTYEIVPNSSELTTPDAIPTNPHIQGNKLILDRNINLIPGNGPIISTNYPGTRIVTMKLSTTAPSFGNHPLNLSWISNGGSSSATAIYAFIDDSTTNVTSGGSLIVENQSAILNLKSVIEGEYDIVNNKSRLKDILNVYQRKTFPPYNKVDSATTATDSITFVGVCFFTNAPTGKYYTVLKYRNAIETWSRSGGDSLIKGSTVNYDFTTDSTKAFGNNLKKVESKFCIYSGDVNQNGSVDLTDLGLIDNAAMNYTTGYVAEDLNGDSFVDIADAQIADNNAAHFVTVIKP
jgi:hypothetical protein